MNTGESRHHSQPGRAEFCPLPLLKVTDILMLWEVFTAYFRPGKHGRQPHVARHSVQTASQKPELDFLQGKKCICLPQGGGHAELITTTKKNPLYVFPSLCLILKWTKESQEWRHSGSHGVWSRSLEAFTVGG